MFRLQSSRLWMVLLLAACVALGASATCKAALIIDVTPTAVVEGVNLTGSIEVDITNTGAAVNITDFQFKITVSAASGITFTNVDTSTTFPYIFDGTGFAGPDITGAGAGTETISATDFDNFSGYILGTGVTLALGHVNFDASAANAGVWPVTLVLADTKVGEFNGEVVVNYDYSTGTEGPITVIRSTTGGVVPEPASLISFAGLLGCSLLLRRRRS